MAEISQVCDFLTWSIQNLVRKVKFARKYYITWLVELAANKLFDTEKLLIPFYAREWKSFFQDIDYITAWVLTSNDRSHH